MQAQPGGIIDQIQKLKEQKVGDKDIKKTLIERGFNAEKVDVALKAYNDVAAKRLLRAGLIDIGIGAVVCIAGIAFTAFTFQLLESAGATRVVVTWGAILFGAAQVLRGIVRVFRGVWNWQ